MPQTNSNNRGRDAERAVHAACRKAAKQETILASVKGYLRVPKQHTNPARRNHRGIVAKFGRRQVLRMERAMRAAKKA